MINYVLQTVIQILVFWLVVLQPFDVHSTILALRLPWVQEVGDEGLGLGNISGWAQCHLGDAWWVIKLPFLAFIPMVWVPIETEVEVPVIMLLVPVVSYFFHITVQNYRNAYSQAPAGWKE